MKRIIVLVVTICFFSLIANGQNDTRLTTYLSGIRIDDITDAGDYLWLISDFNTRIIKFDKNLGDVEYYDYRDFNTSSYDYFLTIECDNNGIPWVGTYAGAFKMMDDNNWFMFHSGPTGVIFRGTDGVIWVAYQYELIRYEGDSIKTFDGYDFSSILSVAADIEGDIWFNRGPFSGIFSTVDELKFDGESWSHYEWFHDDISNLGSLGVISLRNINIDSKNTKWMSGIAHYNETNEIYEAQLLSYSDSNWKLYDLPAPTYIRTIATENEVVWCGTEIGLMQLNNMKWTVFYTGNSELPSNSIRSILVDDNGTKWIGTDQGLVAFNENGLKGTVGVDSKMLNEISLFPNPANDILTLKIPEEFQNPTVDILTLQGKIIQSFHISKNQNRLDVSMLPEGIYLVRIRYAENQITKKVVKQ